MTREMDSAVKSEKAIGEQISKRGESSGFRSRVSSLGFRDQDQASGFRDDGVWRLAFRVLDLAPEKNVETLAGVGCGVLHKQCSTPARI